jgi:hypothetical protein
MLAMLGVSDDLSCRHTLVWFLRFLRFLWWFSLVSLEEYIGVFDECVDMMCVFTPVYST